MKRRVVVTGMGMVTPVGRDLKTGWESLLAGKSGADKITLFPAESFHTKIAAEVKSFSLGNYIDNAERWSEANRNCLFALAAGRMALDDSGIMSHSRLDRSRFGVYLGSGEGQHDFPRFTKLLHMSTRSGKIDTAVYTNMGRSILHPVHESEQEPGTPTGHLANYFGIEGPHSNCLTACAASAQALGEATEMIRRGDADAMLTGGTHSMIHPLGVTGFNLLTALTTRNDEPEKASRPFDRDRDGFLLGEGAGMLVLEELEHAKARDARIFGEIIGYGSTADAFRITDPHEDGRGAIAAIKEALVDAEINPEDIDYINAHGTSTKDNDSIETLAIKHALGESAARGIPVSSTKSMMGHLIAAAGAVEAIICLLAMRDQVMPPTINLDNPDFDCDLDYIPHQARPKVVNIALSNSFGFGGQNISLILRRFVG